MITWIIATIAAFFIKGLCGFANTLVFNSILAYGNNNINVSPVELLLGYPTNIVMTIRERRSIKISVFIPTAILVIAGSIPGVFLLKNLDAVIVKIIFGIVVILIGLEMLIREYSNRKAKGSKALLTAIGLLSGLLCGLYGIGALLGAYISRVSDDTKEFKANICAVFIVENTFRIFLYALTGIMTLEVIKNVILLFPFMILGLFLGIKLSSILDDKVIKKIVIVMLIISGIALIINNL
ncbi:sulfite exporter TauE/SafE family protein [Butyrivibrio hungatei]|uniref:Probable membrane transporter protein n=1 Tax=Butyrivibrio hungatei TaxID=185008 RepID=A0A1D9NXM2_9FIRM|nr:sulfite exporter TauE/SafE family protein [Butyrivibrio hungatei]AOZ95020.1 TauE family protein [Butyrivibrio hungatei]